MEHFGGRWGIGRSVCQTQNLIMLSMIMSEIQPRFWSTMNISIVKIQNRAWIYILARYFHKLWTPGTCLLTHQGLPGFDKRALAHQRKNKKWSHRSSAMSDRTISIIIIIIIIKIHILNHWFSPSTKKYWYFMVVKPPFSFLPRVHTIVTLLCGKPAQRTILFFFWKSY
jgi:hypothetical protein